MLTGDCLNFCLPVVSPDRGVVLLYPVAGIGAMLSTHPVTQWWRDRALLPQRGAGRVGRPHYHQGVPPRLPADWTPGCSERGQSRGCFPNALTFLVPLSSIPHRELRNQDGGRQREKHFYLRRKESRGGLVRAFMAVQLLVSQGILGSVPMAAHLPSRPHLLPYHDAMEERMSAPFSSRLDCPDVGKGEH